MPGFGRANVIKNVSGTVLLKTILFFFVFNNFLVKDLGLLLLLLLIGITKTKE